MTKFVLSLFFFLPIGVWAHEIDTNALVFHNAPDWLKRPRIEKIIDRMQTKMEWTIRKIQVYRHDSAASFAKAHSLGPGVLAVANRTKNEIQIGPSVNEKNFDGVFGHELVHIISGQKYKDAIPSWLEEGLANHLAKNGKVNYAWLAKQPFPEDVTKLGHPFATVVRNPHYHYEASQALAEMIGKKCDLENLMRLSVGKKMTDYLTTYCEIKDLNAEFRAWVKRKA